MILYRAESTLLPHFPRLRRDPISQKILSAETPPRVPRAVDGIQVNFCKNPACPNFGVPPAEHVPRGPKPAGSISDTYIVIAGGPTTASRMSCQLCGELPPLKSNLAIAEERDRLLAALRQRRAPSCPNGACPNHGVPITTDTHQYQSFGRTRSGSRRYRCKACRGTFAVGGSTTGHKQPHKNRTVFALLMNKSPIRRICEVADLTADALYGKIDFLFRQCQAFAAQREQHLQSGLPIRRLYLGVDRQDYVVNWTRQEDRRNLVLHAVGAADNGTGYVFGMHLNYDPSLDADTLESQAKGCGDLQLHPPFRRYARCWLAADYEAAVRRQTRRRLRKPSLPEAIQDTYAEAMEREDVEVFEAQAPDRRLPTKGVQLHAEYTLYGHFFYLRHLLPGIEKFRFFLDQDSGMRAACLGAFQPEIAARRADAFYVRIARELTVPEKRAAVAESRREFQRARASHPDLSDTAVKLSLIKEQLEKMAPFGRWQDKWMMHPFPTLSEPKKAVCHLTDYGDYDTDHLAWLYNKASLHAITCFFMQVRRRLSLLERPLATTSNFGRRWYGYSPYNPENISKLLTIFRVFYNYCLAGAGGNTPAMRLGLAKRKLDPKDIIYF